jgi:ABC-type lipoprotein export system ATPase subunit
VTGVGDRPATSVAAPLEVRGLGLEYPRPGDGGALRVLRDIELVLRTRTLGCIAGRSGSGKTSLLMLCAGFLRPTEGTVLWGSTPIEQLPASEVMRLRRGFLGIVFQHGALIPSLTAAENVALVRGADGRLVSGVTEARQALRRVGLDGRADHFPSQLSGGEQQRVAIARALNGNPPVVVIDEPTASLDRKSADQIIELLTDVRDTGYAVLVASHDRHVIDAAEFVVSLD